MPGRTLPFNGEREMINIFSEKSKPRSQSSATNHTDGEGQFKNTNAQKILSPWNPSQVPQPTCFPKSGGDPVYGIPTPRGDYVRGFAKEDPNPISLRHSYFLFLLSLLSFLHCPFPNFPFWLNISDIWSLLIFYNIFSKSWHVMKNDKRSDGMARPLSPRRNLHVYLILVCCIHTNDW